MNSTTALSSMSMSVPWCFPGKDREVALLDLVQECTWPMVLWIMGFWLTNASAIVSTWEVFQQVKEEEKDESKEADTKKENQKNEQVNRPTELLSRKRKTRDTTFGVESDACFVQGKLKKRRIVRGNTLPMKIQVFQSSFMWTPANRAASSSPGRHGQVLKRACSFDSCQAHELCQALGAAGNNLGLRRVFSSSEMVAPSKKSMSCWQPTSQEHMEQPLQKQELNMEASKAKQEEDQEGNSLWEMVKTLFNGVELASERHQLTQLVVSNLRRAACNAFDELLSSLVSFVTYALMICILRQYCPVAIGVSFDVGAFSIEL